MFIFAESIPFPSSQPVYNNNIYPNEPIKQGPTVDVIHNKNQKQHPVINGGIDHKIQPLYTSVEPGPIKLNSVPEPYISPTTSTQRERAEIAHAAAQANDRAAVLTAKEAQLARAVTKPDFKQTNTYIPPKQYQYANLPSGKYIVPISLIMFQIICTHLFMIYEYVHILSKIILFQIIIKLGN